MNNMNNACIINKLMTQRAYCEYICKKYAREFDCSVDDLEKHMFESSTLCVALEYLGKIKNPDMKSYAATRGGVFAMDYIPNENGGISYSLTMRDLLNLLPDDDQ